MCTPDMVWRPKQEISHEKRCLLDSTADGRGPAFQPLGPKHPRLFNPRPTTQQTYTQTPPPRPTRPSYSPTTYKPSYNVPTYKPTYKSGYGVPRGQPLGK